MDLHLDPYVEELSALSNLRHIELVGVRFPDLHHFLQLIYSISRLQSISILDGIKISSLDDPSETISRYSCPPGQPSFHFCKLDLGNQFRAAGVSQWILGLRPRPVLQHLCIGSFGDKIIQPLIHLAGSSLQDLELLSGSEMGESTLPAAYSEYLAEFGPSVR